MQHQEIQIEKKQEQQLVNNGLEPTGVPNAQTAFEEKHPWCRRDGHNRICLTCGQNTKSEPKGCTNPRHHHSFAAKQAYNQSYWGDNKRRLLIANRNYRRSNPGVKKWMRQYHREWYARNRARKLAQNRDWEKRNAEKRKLYLRRKALQWYRRHRKRALANIRRYYDLHKSRKNSRRNELLKAARKNNPGARLLYNFRTRLSTLIRRGGEKGFSITHGVLLYSGDQLRRHLEKQFTSKMSWANYGKYWEVDHILECAGFDLTDLEQCRKCYALQNLRPLEIKLNRSRFHGERRKAKLTRSLASHGPGLTSG